MTTIFSDYGASIHHDGSARYVRLPGGKEPDLGDEAALRLRSRRDAPIERVLLRTTPDGEQHFVEMLPEEQPLRPGEDCRWWRTTLRLEMPVTNYRFLIFTPDGAFWYNGTGLHRNLVTDAQDFRILAGYAAPVWVRSSVFYQIFPDRFANGDPTNDVRSGEYEYWGHPVVARQWGERPSTGRAGSIEFFGGDLPGILQRLDYLSGLGVNAIYLNPVFTALSNHRYDVADYFAVDPHLGGNKALAAFRRDTLERGMRYLLDVVPNHCGIHHPWFQQALQDPSASSASFFTFYTHPADYACWLGVRGLPKLNYRSQELRNIMYVGADSAIRHWLRPPYAADGWRLDVANMLARQGADQLGEEVGRGIRQAVKEENPQAYLLGENFFDATPQLQGDLWDASMNYSGFSKPVRYWLSGFSVSQHGQARPWVSRVPWTGQALLDSWKEFRASIPWVIARQQFNLLGSHDTTRFLDVVDGDPGLNRLGVGLLMTAVGVPCVYYGDEIGLSGGEQAIRACMVWEREGWDEDLREFYRRLVALRRTSPALIEGGFQELLAEENTLAYLRDVEEELLVVVAHRGPGDRAAQPLPLRQAGIADGVVFAEIFSGRQATVSSGALPLSAVQPGIQIWQARV